MSYEQQIADDLDSIQAAKDIVLSINKDLSKSEKVSELNKNIHAFSKLQNLDQTQVLMFACETLGLSSRDITDIKKACKRKRNQYADGLRWDVSDTGELKKTFSNTKNFLIQSGIAETIRFNSFAFNIELTGALPWEKHKVDKKMYDENTSIKVKEYLADICRFDIDRKIINEAILAIALDSSYHPVKEYLNSIEWDGVERLDTWMIRLMGCEDSIYVREISRKMLCACVKRVFKPGCEFHNIVVFEGKQGVGKTSVVKILSGEWYGSVSIDINHKDVIACLNGVWMNEIGEMAGMDKRDLNYLKKFITDPVDRVRMPYAQRPDFIPRQWILVGTINPEGANTYLKDRSGNRRFWPVETFITKDSLDFAALKNERDQLFAEAMCMLKKGESLNLEHPDAIAEHLRKTASRVQRDEVLEYKIKSFLDCDMRKFTMAELFLFLDVKDATRSQRWLETNIGIVLKEMNCSKHRDDKGYYYIYNKLLV